MQKDDIRTIAFAAVTCLIVSLLLSSTYAALKDRQEKNEELDRKFNVLRAFGVETVIDDVKIDEEEVDEYFDNIREVLLDETFVVIAGASRTNLEVQTAGKYKLDMIDNKKLAPYPLFLWESEGEVEKYCYPQYGKGLWSTVYSYVALGKDFKTVIGATFYGHKETPGLGGECSEDWFMDQFKGKQLSKDFRVVKGQAREGVLNAVDGMSGATITGNGIQKFLREEYVKYSKFFANQSAVEKVD